MKNNLSIKAVGDIAPGDFIINGIGVLSTTHKYGCDFIFDKIRSQLSDCDLLIGNLEDVLSKRCFEGNLRHCGHPEIAKALRKIGFDVLSLANNHSFDHGRELFLETLEYCKTSGIEVCGLRGNNGYFCQPVILERKGNKIGILAYNWIGLERDDFKEFSEYVAVVEDSAVNYSIKRNPSKDKENRENIKKKNKRVLNDIERLREEVDILILLPHWGYEWTIYPPYGLTVEAKTFIDAGVDIIIGSHSHVPQGVEMYNNRLIVYSLGNFLFDGFSDEGKFGMIIETQLRKRVVDYKLSFVRRNDKFQPVPSSPDEIKKNMTLIDMSNNAINGNDIENRLNDEVIFKEFVRQYKKMKYKTILYLISILPQRPFLLIPFFKKVISFFYVVFLNLKGNRVRW